MSETHGDLQGIWPPHEAFYLEALLHCTTTALHAADEVQLALVRGSAFAPSSDEWQEAALAIMHGVQNLILQAAAISRFFWPASEKEPHASRAARLRGALAVSDSSPLRNRDLRNHLEHLDERLDLFCRELRAGVIVPAYVGPFPEDSSVPTYCFRAYYTDLGVFEILGHRFKIQPVLDEMSWLHDKLLWSGRNGGRLPASR